MREPRHFPLCRVSSQIGNALETLTDCPISGRTILKDLLASNCSLIPPCCHQGYRRRRHGPSANHPAPANEMISPLRPAASHVSLSVNTGSDERTRSSRLPWYPGMPVQALGRYMRLSWKKSSRNLYPEVEMAKVTPSVCKEDTLHTTDSFRHQYQP